MGALIGVALGGVDGLAQALVDVLVSEATIADYRQAVRRFASLSERIILRSGEVSVAPVALAAENTASCTIDTARIGILFPFATDERELAPDEPGYASLIEAVYALFRLRAYGTIRTADGSVWTFREVEGVPFDAPEVSGDDAATGSALWAFLVVARYERQRT